MRPELVEFWDYLDRYHRGKARAIMVERLSCRLNKSPRLIRAMAEELTTEYHKPIASTIRPPYGLYVAITPEEKEEYCAQLDARIRAIARRRRAFTSIPLLETIRQMEMENILEQNM